MHHNILVTPRSFAKWDPSPLNLMESLGYLVKRNPRQQPFTESEMIEQIKNIDGVIVGIDPVTSKVIAAAERLRVISKYGVGLDNIDMEAATKRGIVVTSTPGANTESVADLTFGLMISVARRIIEADQALRAGRWERFMGMDIWGRTLGVIGTGRIGKAVVNRAKGFNMRIFAYDTWQDSEWAAAYGVKYVDLEQLMIESDFVSIHIALNDETCGLVDKKLINLMKPTGILVNTARGGIVDETALSEALRKGKIFGAALDVFTEEPLVEQHLLSTSGLSITPHIGAYSRGALENMGKVAVENMIAVLQGIKPEHVVNKAVYN